MTTGHIMAYKGVLPTIAADAAHQSVAASAAAIQSAAASAAAAAAQSATRAAVPTVPALCAESGDRDPERDAGHQR